MTILEFGICFFFILTMFPAFHMFCLIGIDKLVTYFSNKKIL